jgi:hypothetical protein
MQNGVPTFDVAGKLRRLTLNSEDKTWHCGPWKITGVKPGKPRGPWAEPYSSAVTVAIKLSGRERLAGFQSTLTMPSGTAS